MRIPRGTLAGFALLTSATLALTGCTTSGKADRPAAGAPAATAAEPATDSLVKSTIQLSKGNYTYTMKGGAQSYEGVVHLPQSALLTVVDTSADGGEFAYLVVGKDRWVKLKMELDLGEDMPSPAELEQLADQSPEIAKMAKQLKTLTAMVAGKKWLVIDPKRVDEFGEGFNGFEHPDATGASYLLSTARSATRAGDTITGDLDLSTVKADQVPWDSEEVLDLKAAGKVPYAATLDGEGRLVKLVLDLPAMGEQKAHRETIEVTGYGAAALQTKPATGDTIRMTDDMYDVLNGR
ncbi:hypothetical protein [Spirilliplanes yamanashiensis]|uniref:Lipoprotein n=1 Tax=Spirilliplanes yamanashiensis TaxID=42233 RepID=A0A8J3Y3L6_9ACTN|nr:hypothetical protein [Spirilliplanes yamanashiensis]MDP9814112.1 hypothetical protein [Spirilliplanes yamanashiensis]GIJ00907.1 hypothetical protein Sya03_02590 [Spirilliplanes yamanashiensis]